MTGVAPAPLPLREPAPPTRLAQEMVRDALARGVPLRIAGRGCWMDAGRPVRAEAELSLAQDAGITEYVPGDLTLTARAGTPLAEIERATAAEGQFLALDPFGPTAGTLGATVATASYGPLAHAFGLPRDNVLGLEFVTGEGTVARGGGRVVKNVAGFDLTRLLIGAWGTLGIITEVSVRLRARPEMDRTVAMPLPDGVGDLAALLRGVRQAPLAPWAVEMVNAALARRLGAGDGPLLLVRLAGNEADVRAEREALAAIGDVDDAPAGVWDALRVCEPAGATVARFSRLPTQMADTWSYAGACAAAFPDALVHASAGRGVARLIIPPAPREAIEHALRIPWFNGTRVYERLPAPLWSALAPSPLHGRLARDLRRAFDPRHILNPGILGESDA